MKNYINLLKKVQLFKGISEDEILSLIDCLSPQIKKYKKNQAVFLMGERITDMGIICTGTVQVIKEDYFGNRTILALLEAGDLFGETFSCAQTEKIPVSVFACSDCEILFFNYGRVLHSCTHACMFHSKLINNMTGILALKNIILNQKIEILSKRTTRDKILTYLSSYAQTIEKNSFIIPFNRQELADYLCVDRSAMSNELSKLKDEGQINYHKNFFEILQTE